MRGHDQPTTPQRVAVFTICSNNYLPFAHVLFESVRHHHPGMAQFLCLADRKIDRPGLYDLRWTVIEAEALPIPDFRSFAFRYDIMEFNTALKPFMFLHLLQACGFDAVLYFDPDIQLFAPLATVLDAFSGGASFVFTPHLCSPCEDRQEPNDIAIMRAGAYNLGFLGVSRTHKTVELLGWWARRLRYQCLNAQADGLFVDQKFMDLAPGFDPNAAICYDTTLNVAYWNLPQRRLCDTGGGWTVDGAPLTFFHFSGFNPGDPSRLSKHDRRFAADLAEPLRKLTVQYAQRLLAHGYGTFPGAVYAYGHFASGVAIHPLVREMFREWHPFWESDPFGSYEAFLHEAWPYASRTVPHHVVTNFMRFLHGATPRLGNRLDLADPAAVGRLVCWFVNDAMVELGLDPALIQPAAARLGQWRSPPAISPREVSGETDVTLTAPVQDKGAAGQCGRRSFHALLASDLAVEMLDGASPAPGSDAPVQIICLAADQIATALPAWAAQAPVADLRILVPAWDLGRLANAALPCLDLVHEIWAPSRAIQIALAGRTDRPVIYMPLAIEVNPLAVDPARFGLPADRFVFIAAFDVRPTWDREDPRIAIEAFRLAFARNGQACLVLASRDGRLTAGQSASLQAVIDGDPDILLFDQGLSPRDMLSLMASGDAALSLHRSQGLGLQTAEAMLLGKPVIATSCGAGDALVTELTGYPVEYRLEHRRATHDMWAEPDIAHAAWLMRALEQDPLQAGPRVARARDHVERHHGRDHVAALQRGRLHALGVVPR